MRVLLAFLLVAAPGASSDGGSTDSPAYRACGVSLDGGAVTLEWVPEWDLAWVHLTIIGGLGGDLDETFLAHEKELGGVASPLGARVVEIDPDDGRRFKATVAQAVYPELDQGESVHVMAFEGYYLARYFALAEQTPGLDRVC